MKNHLPLRVVTVAFNPGPDLASMAASLENATSDPYELVIVDNGSDPTVVDDVARRFSARVIRPGENLGYGRAANLGLASAHPWPAYAVREYPRVGFILINNNHYNFIFPTKETLDFSQGADVIVLACSGDDFLEARVISFGDRTYQSAPLSQTCN